MTMRNNVLGKFLVVCMAIALVASAAMADPNPPIGPTGVGGKEYSNDFDETAAGVIDNHQNIMFDGFGGAADSLD